MKHKPYNCNCCKKDIKYARGVEVKNMTNPILCNNCNMELIKTNQLQFDESILLKVTGKRGDFLIIEAFTYRKKTKEELNKEFWDNRARVKELAAMDNQPTDNWDVHGSY